MKTISIIGDGGWGTALGLMLHQKGHPVRMWGPFPDYLDRVRSERQNPLYLPDVPIPETILWTADHQEAVSGTDLVVIAVPTQFFRPVMERFAPLIPATASVISVSKGLDKQTHQRMTDVARALLKREEVAALSGPSHAEEVARGVPTAVVIAHENHSFATRLQHVFMNARFRVYTSDDVIGVELGGAFKNVIALAVGASDGIGFGDNTRAALITRGLAEMTRLGCAMGARRETFSGLSGMGDLIVTCTSRWSRNRAVGERLGKGEPISQILDSMKQVAEGVGNCAIVKAIAGEKGIRVPIAEEVHNIIYAGKAPREAVRDLMTRGARPERD